MADDKPAILVDGGRYGFIDTSKPISPIAFGAIPDRLICSRCNKKLSRKSARMIDRKPLCSTCMFASK